MHETPEFPVVLRLIDERSTAFRVAVATAPDLDVRVPTCPEWMLFDLARHLGEGRRAWAATVAAGPVRRMRRRRAGRAGTREVDHGIRRRRDRVHPVPAAGADGDPG